MVPGRVDAVPPRRVMLQSIPRVDPWVPPANPDAPLASFAGANPRGQVGSTQVLDVKRFFDAQLYTDHNALELPPVARLGTRTQRLRRWVLRRWVLRRWVLPRWVRMRGRGG